MSDWKGKLSSRKFWISVAAFLGSVGTSVAGFATKSEAVAAIGILCATLSAAIYAAAEAYVDTARLAQTSTQIIKNESKATQTNLQKDLNQAEAAKNDQ